MGREYHISIEPSRSAELKDWLRRRGARFVEFHGKECAEFRFARPEDESTMPDATVILEDAVIYFCEVGHSDKVAAIFKGLVDEALTRSSSSDSVRITSL